MTWSPLPPVIRCQYAAAPMTPGPAKHSVPLQIGQPGTEHPPARKNPAVCACKPHRFPAEFPCPPANDLLLPSTHKRPGGLWPPGSCTVHRRIRRQRGRRRIKRPPVQPEVAPFSFRIPTPPYCLGRKPTKLKSSFNTQTFTGPSNPLRLGSSKET